MVEGAPCDISNFPCLQSPICYATTDGLTSPGSSVSVGAVVGGIIGIVALILYLGTKLGIIFV